jgi:hypothetical protein
MMVVNQDLDECKGITLLISVETCKSNHKYLLLVVALSQLLRAVVVRGEK